MSSTWKKNNRKRKDNRGRDSECRYKVRGVRREPVDISKLSKALLGLVMAETERQAQAEHAARTQQNTELEDEPGDMPQPGGGRDA